MKALPASLLALLAGALGVLAFAPFGLFPLAPLSLAGLFLLWLRSPSPKRAAGIGFLYGLGLFGLGVGWIFVALYRFGEMPFLLALLATLLFAALLALLPALAGYLQARLQQPAATTRHLLLTMPAIWVASELLRGYFLTGFPWLTLGYSQTASPLSGFAPVLGVYGVSLTVALTAGMLAWGWQRQASGWPALVGLLILWDAGAMLHQVHWTQATGEPIKVALLQGNIPQDRKFEEGQLLGTLELYRELAQRATDARLVILPESALPVLRERIAPDYLDALASTARSNRGDILVGLFNRQGDDFYNSASSFGSAPEQQYHKDHLVPFGEFIPLRGLFGPLINDVLRIPMSDLARGGPHQAPLEIAGQRVAVDICYEDVFGEEIARALPQATLLVNLTNDAWYGDSHAAAQHNQISQMRALESGRMMLRATNTGMTSIIAPDGSLLRSLPQHVEGVLTGTAQGYTGSTPYARWRNAAILILLCLLLAPSLLRTAKRP